MAKYKIVKLPKYPGGGEVELQGMRYRKDDTGKFFYLTGAPITDPLLIQKLTYEAKPVGSSPAVAPSPYGKPDIRTGSMKVQAALQGPPTTTNAAALKTANEQKKKEDAAIALQKKLDAEAKLKLEEEQAFALANPNAALSETLPGVAAKVTPQTEDQWKNFEGAKQEYYDKRNFLADITLQENYDNVAYEVARDIQKNNPKLSFEEALAKAKEDQEALKKKAINTYVTQDPDVLDRVARERGFYSPQKAGNTFIKSFNPNDPRYVSFADPGTVEGYLTQAKDVLLNPLDATHYFMTNEEMPFNYGAYEEMKQRNGYEDASDKNVVLNALDQASWFHPVGLYGQGMKMIEPTAESIQNVVEDPTLDNFGTAAWDLGMTALTFAGAKSPLKFMAEESQAIRDAHFVSDFMRKPTGPNPANSGTGLLPVTAIESAPSVLPTIVTDASVASENLSRAAMSAESNAAKNFSNPNYLDDAAVADLIDDARFNKIQQWQTPEGQTRLQQVIDSTPSLKGQTPQSMIEGVQSMNVASRTLEQARNKRNALVETLDDLDLQKETGLLNEQEWRNKVFGKEMELSDTEDLIEALDKDINKAGFLDHKTNDIHVQGNRFTEPEVKRITSHELGHYLGKGSKTNLDDMLGDLELVSDTSHQLSIKGLNPATEFSESYNTFGQGKDNYVQNSLKYFKDGSAGTEKVPFLSEVRQDMLEKGIIQSEYDKITPKMLKEHFKDYKNTQGEKYPLRLYDIMKDKPENFNRLSKVLDKLPMIMQAAGLADAFFGDEDVNTKEAGFSLMLGALSKGKGKALKFGKGLKKFVNTGKSAILYEDKAIKNYAKELNRQSLEKYAQSYTLAGSDEAMALKSQFRDEVEAVKHKLKNNLEDSVVKRTDVMNSYQKSKELNKIGKNIPNLKLTEEGIEAIKTSPLEHVTTQGIQPITSFKTGKPVTASVKMPQVGTTYIPKKDKLEIKYLDSSNPEVSPEYLQVLNDNIQHVQELTNAKVFGSAIGVTEGGLPHLTGDIDALILDKDYNTKVKPKLQFIANKGPAKIHEIGIRKGSEGHIDFNIIHTNNDGTVKVNWMTDPNTGQKRSLELELFRQFFPDKYYAEQKKAIEKLGSAINLTQKALPTAINLLKGVNQVDPVSLNLQIPISAKEFMDKIDPAVKTVIDAYESSKSKHINRIDTYINYGNVDVVRKGQQAYVNSLVGSKGSVGPQLSKEALSDVSENLNALLAMGFVGDAEYVANSPERMQLALNDYYINNSIHTRQVTAKGSMEQLENAFKKWDITYGGGNARGYGLNTVKLGDPMHGSGNVFGQLQYKVNVDPSSPMKYVDSIKFSSSGVGEFTPKQKEVVKEVIKKYSGSHYNELQAEDIKQTGDLLHNIILRSMSIDPVKKNEIQSIFNEITNRLGVRSAAQSEIDQYGNSRYSSVLGDFDEASDLLQYSIMSLALKPKSLLQRQQEFQAFNSKNTGTVDSDLITTLKDYKKIENYINGGYSKAKARLDAFYDDLNKVNTLMNEKAERYAATKNPELKKQIDDLQKQVDDYQIEAQELAKQEEAYHFRVQQIRAFRSTILPLLLGAVTVGAASKLMYDEWTKPEETGFNNMFNADELSSKEKKYVNSYYNKHKSLKGLTWPNGDPAEIHQTQGEKLLLRRAHIKPPKTRMKKGGEIELDLTPEEIQEYIQKGYVVEQQ